MKVQVFSMIAAVHGAENVVWSGEIPDESLDALGPEQVNAFLFHFFNRIEYMDEEQLAALGYDLPSLSMGDFITWGGRTYQVAATGMIEVTGNAAYLLVVGAIKDHEHCGPGRTCWQNREPCPAGADLP